MATDAAAAEGDDLIGDAWVVDPQEEQTEESALGEGEEESEQKSSWLAKLRGGLAKTGKSIGGIFVGVRVDEALFEELDLPAPEFAPTHESSDDRVPPPATLRELPLLELLPTIS